MRGLNNRQNKINIMKRYGNCALYKSQSRLGKNRPDLLKKRAASKLTLKQKDTR
ncbi:MAG: hypothetical protein HY811_10590 [Planctomycetes bacterium]|nr:hypothetical protein [Planctomycetota bacterium]